MGKLIASCVAGQPAPEPFRYFDKGNLAVIGKNFAILESGKLQLSGFLGWAAWAGIHLVYLPQAQNRGQVLLQWAWAYAIGKQSSRVILDCPAPMARPDAPRPPVSSSPAR